MLRRSRRVRKPPVVEVRVVGRDLEDRGVGVVLRRRPLTLLVPSHVITLLEIGEATAVFVDGCDHGLPRIVPRPALEQDHLSVLRLTAHGHMGRARLPRRPVQLVPGLAVHIQGYADGRLRDFSGHVLEVSAKERVVVTDIEIARGTSGSPLLVGDRMVGICQGKKPGSSLGSAVVIPFDGGTLRDLREIIDTWRRWVGAVMLVALAVAAGLSAGIALFSWLAFSVQRVEPAGNQRSLLVQNAHLLTFRPTWRYDLAAPISDGTLHLFASHVGGRKDHIVVGTRSEGGNEGRIVILSSTGRRVGEYSIPSGGCIYSESGTTCSGFDVARVYVGDVDGDGRNEIMGVFAKGDSQSELVVLDLQGRPRSEYWHPGPIEQVLLRRLGDELTPTLVAAGVNAALQDAGGAAVRYPVVFALDPTRVKGQAPPYVPSFPSGQTSSQKWYVRFPGPETTDAAVRIERLSIGESDAELGGEVVVGLSDGRMYRLDSEGQCRIKMATDSFFRAVGQLEGVPSPEKPPFWPTEMTLPEGALRRFGMGYLKELQFSPNGDWLAVVTSLGVEIREADTLELAWFLSGHQGTVSSVAFSPDGKSLASASDDGAIRLWDLASGTRNLTLTSGRSREALCVAFSPHSRVVAAGFQDGTLRLWEAATGKELCPPRPAHLSSVNCLAFSPDAKVLASGSDDGKVRIWNAENGEALSTLSAYADKIVSMVFDPTGHVLALGSVSTIRLVDVATSQTLFSLAGDAAFAGKLLAFRTDGMVIASASERGTLSTWDTVTGERQPTLGALIDNSEFFALKPDWKFLASGSYSDGTVKLWDLTTNRDPVGMVRGYSLAVTCIGVGLGSGKRLLASGFQDGSLTMWEADTGREVYTLRCGISAVCIAFSLGGNVLASGADDGITLWDAATGEVRRTLSGLTANLDSLIFSPNGELLAFGTGDGIISLWSASAGGQPRPVAKHTGFVKSIAFTPDAKAIALGSEDRAAELRDIATGRVVATFRGRASPSGALALSPDGTILAVGSHDGTIEIWAVADVRVLRSLSGEAKVTSLAFSTDGQTIASGCEDGGVILWDVVTGRNLCSLTGHPREVTSLAFTPDGKILASGSMDGTVLLWDLGSIMLRE